MAGRQTHTPTTLEEWTRSDEYHNSFLIPKDDVLDAVVKNNHDQGLPNIAVSTAQGKFLNLLVKPLGRRESWRLELSAGGGQHPLYSTIWIGRALPSGGSVTTLELNEHHAKVATDNIKLAGLADKISVVVGPAAESLAKLDAKEPFDFAFIDADKPSNLIYFTEAKRLVRPGGVIIVDNVVRYGRVADPEFTDANVEGVRRLLHALKDDQDVEATTIGTVGEKGYDGFIYAVRK